MFSPRKLCMVVICLIASMIFCGSRYYVKTSGSDANGGTSWDDALLTITTAVGVASSGDEIWVAAGTYVEGDQITVADNVSLYGGFAGTESDLSERNTMMNQTIIDGNNAHRCIINHGMVDAFWVTRGYVNSTTDNHGGGVYNTGTVANCIITESSTSGNGGGISNGGDGINGGTVTGCVISGNTSAKEGGGIYNYLGGDLINCVVYNNTANHSSGGIYNAYGGNINCCTVYGNKSDSNNGGCGIQNFGFVRNSIVWHNYDMNQESTISDLRASGYGDDSYCCYSEATGSSGTIAMVPLFVNISGDASTWDFHLQGSSPCIDTGTATDAPATDIEDVTRPQGDGIDMGAFEFPAQNTGITNQLWHEYR